MKERGAIFSSVVVSLLRVDLLLRNRDFRWLWIANLASSLAGWSLGIALPVHVFAVTGSALATSTLLVASTLPAIVLGSVGGVVADRVRRDLLLKVVSWARVGTVASLLLAADQPFWMYVLAFLQSALMQFFTPAEQATVAAVVPAPELASALSTNAAARNAARLAGPALGGVLVTWAGFTVATALISGSLGIAALCLTRLPPSAPCHQAAVAPGSAIRDWLDGLRTAAATPVPRAVAVLQILDAVKEGPFTSLFPVLLLSTIGASGAYLGVVNSSFAVTAVIGACVTARVIARCGYRRPIAVGTTLSGLLIVLLASMPSAPIALASSLLSGFPFTVSWVAANTWLLIDVPPTHSGRVTGTISSVNAAATAAFAAVAGVAAEVLPVTTVIGIAATVQALAGPIFIAMTRHLPQRGGHHDEA